MQLYDVRDMSQNEVNSRVLHDSKKVFERNYEYNIPD